MVRRGGGEGRRGGEEGGALTGSELLLLVVLVTLTLSLKLSPLECTPGRRWRQRRGRMGQVQSRRWEVR